MVAPLSRVRPMTPAGPELRRTPGLSDAVVVGLGSMIRAGVSAVVAAVVAYDNALCSARLAALYQASRGTYLWPAHTHVVPVAAVVAPTAVNHGGLRKSAWLTRVIVTVLADRSRPAPGSWGGVTDDAGDGPGQAPARIARRGASALSGAAPGGARRGLGRRVPGRHGGRARGDRLLLLRCTGVLRRGQRVGLDARRVVDVAGRTGAGPGRVCGGHVLAARDVGRGGGGCAGVGVAAYGVRGRQGAR